MAYRVVKSPVSFITLGLGLGGEGTALHMAKILVSGQNGGCVNKGSSEILRTGHELSVRHKCFVSRWCLRSAERGHVLADVLEVICRRIAVLVEAHSQPSRPNWTAARCLEGAPMSEEVILPALRSCAMRRAKEEVDIQNASAEVAHPALPRMMTTKMLGDGKGANKKGRRGRVLSAPDG